MRGPAVVRVSAVGAVVPPVILRGLNDAARLRDAIARFDQVENVSAAERDEAWKRIVRAADRFGVAVDARSWRQLVNS